MRSIPTVTKIPASMQREIGRIIFNFAHVEYCLIRLSYTLLGISPKQGRISLRNPRGHELADMVRDLFGLAGLTNKLKFDFQTLHSTMRTLNGERDLLAHCVWLREKSGGPYFVLRTRGSWQPNKKIKGKVKREISPEAQEYGLTDLIDVRTRMELMVDLVLRLKIYVEALMKERDTKREKRSPRKSPPPSRSPSKRKPPQKASPA